MDQVSNKLHDQHLAARPHQLVNLQLQFAEARLEPDSATITHSAVPAVTEPNRLIDQTTLPVLERTHFPSFAGRSGRAAFFLGPSFGSERGDLDGGAKG